MDIFLHIIHALSALVLIVLILLQQGKGADAGASFGSGASGTMFGSAGSANFMTRSTAVLAAIFMVTSLALAWQAKRAVSNNGMGVPALEKVIQEQQQAAGQTTAPKAPAAVPTVSNSTSNQPTPATGVGDVPSLNGTTAPAGGSPKDSH